MKTTPRWHQIARFRIHRRTVSPSCIASACLQSLKYRHKIPIAKAYFVYPNRFFQHFERTFASLTVYYSSASIHLHHNIDAWLKHLKNALNSKARYWYAEISFLCQCVLYPSLRPRTIKRYLPIAHFARVFNNNNINTTMNELRSMNADVLSRKSRN